MKTRATVVQIGADSVDSEDPMVILFDESASSAISKVAILQEFENLEDKKRINLQVGDKIIIDNSSYTINFVGKMVNSNMKKIGHVTLIFSNMETDLLQSSIQLSPEVPPEFKIGTKIIYETRD